MECRRGGSSGKALATWKRKQREDSVGAQGDPELPEEGARKKRGVSGVVKKYRISYEGKTRACT